MGKVVDFPEVGEARKAESAERNDTEQRKKAAAIRLRLDSESGNRPMSDADQRFAAEGVWRLLCSVEKYRYSKADVLREANIGSVGDSTKHLGQYALDPGRNKPGAVIARLNKRPAKYRAIAEAWSRLSGTNEHDALVEVFGRTSLSEDPHQRAAPEEYQHLALTLRQIADAVAKKHKLQTYFQELARTELCLMVVDEPPEQIKLEFSCQSTPSPWPIPLDALSGERRFYDFNGAMPAYPTVVLGKWPTAWMAARVKHNPCGGQTQHEDVINLEYSIDLQYSAELRFCIVPTGPDMAPEAALRVHLEISIRPFREANGNVALKFSAVPCNSGYKNQYIEAVSANGNVCPYSLIIDSPDLPSHLKLLLESFDRENEEQVKSNCKFYSISANNLQDWLSNDRQFDEHWMDKKLDGHILTLGPAILADMSAEGISSFRGGTIAAALDMCLHEQSSTNFLDFLEERTRRLVDLWTDYCATEKKHRKLAAARLQDRLSKLHEESGDQN